MATSSLGRLTLDLAVRLSEFTDGMSRAERETQDRTQRMQESVTSFREHLASELGGTQLGGIIDTFNERFGSIEGSITKVGGALAGMAVGGMVVGIGALSKMAVETAKADAEMAIFAQRANTTVESFQVLSKAAEGLGYSQEQLSSVLADTQEKLGEFTATEGGEAKDFFDALKNNTKMTEDQIRQFGKTLSGKDGVEAIQLIKNKMDELGATSQEQRFVFESLANDLTNLLPLFEDGGKLLGVYGEELRKAGVIKTKEAIEQSQILAAQTQSVQQRFSVFKTQLSSAMMPVLNSLLQHYMSGSEKGAAFGGVIQSVAVVAKGAAAIILTFTTAIGMFGNTIGQVLAQLSNLGDTYVAFENAEGVIAKAQALAQGFRNARTMGSDWWNQMVSDAKRADATMGAIVNGQNGKLDALTQANLKLEQSQRRANDGLKISTKQADEAAKAQEKLNKEKEKGAKLNAASVAVAAAQDVGVTEAANPNKIMGYQRAVGYMSGRIDAWCASFVGAALEKSGFKSTRSASARSYDNYGVGINKNGVIPSGAIATVARSGGSGRHVFIIERDLGNGKVATIEGNAGRNTDRVIRGVRDKSQLITVRIPITKDGKVADTGTDSKSLTDFSRIDDMRDSDLQKQAQDTQRAAEEHQRNMQSIVQKYATKDESIEAEHTKNLELINKTYAQGSVEWTKYIKTEKQRYYDEMYEYTTSVALKYATEEEKIDIEHYKKLREIKRDFVNDPTERDRRIALENESYQKDVANFKWAQGEKARAQKALIDKIREDIGTSSADTVNELTDLRNKAVMRPEAYERWKLDNDLRKQTGLTDGLYQKRQGEINAIDTKTGDFQITDETERNKLLQEAEQEHATKMLLIQETYQANLTDMEKRQQQARMQSTADTFAGMTSAAATFFGQQSAMYRAAFAMEKAYAVYKAVMNIRETYSNTYNSVAAIPVIGPYIAAPTAAAAAAVQVAQAAQLRSMQAPSVGGIAHGGLDYVPKETTFLLDEGERVLSPRQNKDLTRYLNERQANTGGNVNVYNNSSAQVTAERQPNGEVTIEVVDKMIKRSWGNVAQASSFESRQIQKHTTARFNRQ